MLSPSSASTRAPVMSRERRRLHRHALEERRVADVGRVGVPREPVAGRHLQRPASARRRSNTSAYCSRNMLRRHRRAASSPESRARSARCRAGRPAAPSLPVPSGSVVRSIVILPGQRVGDDERRRREVVRAHLLLDAALEVAVAAQHRRDDEVARFDLRRHVVRQRTAVADAGRAAVADEVEAELVEIQVEARLLADTR